MKRKTSIVWFLLFAVAQVVYFSIACRDSIIGCKLAAERISQRSLDSVAEAHELPELSVWEHARLLREDGKTADAYSYESSDSLTIYSFECVDSVCTFYIKKLRGLSE